MRIFLAGATGVLGRRLVPLLVAAGHQVTGMTRSPDKADPLADLGADVVVCDVYDREALIAAVVDARPDLVLHELTDLPDDPQLIAAQVGANARIRREGTRNLVAAAQAAGAGRFFAQSLAWSVGGDGDAAVADLEAQTLAVGGVVLRYGQFWGEGTYHDHPPAPPHVQIDRAAVATVDALDAPSGVTITITDDDPGSADA